MTGGPVVLEEAELAAVMAVIGGRVAGAMKTPEKCNEASL